ncbi:MAG: hypothetical protein QM809_02915 [Gordonia sp. (in: high G+C Gram-positive bacteria)]|uniref:hypothetical protein n=1 Tax=Gordonia sp. (in: high G+C Gram-positive bacteria) TaxID=84139 RepID=UPI0039E419FF
MQPLVARARELREWWLLKRNDPAALARAAQQVPGGRPRGPRLGEVLAAGGAVIMMMFVFLVILGLIVGPAPEQKAAPVGVYATSTATSSTTTTAEEQERRSALVSSRMSSIAEVASAEAAPQKPDLPAVPLGHWQTIEGVTKKTGIYKAKVAVTKVVRTSPTDVYISAKINVTQGSLLLSDSWALITGKERTAVLNGVGEDGFEYTVSGTAEGNVYGHIRRGEGTDLEYIRLQPRRSTFTVGKNQAAVWSIGKAIKSFTPTPTPDPVETTSPSADYNVPDVDAPNVNVPDFDRPHKRKRCGFRWC